MKDSLLLKLGIKIGSWKTAGIQTLRQSLHMNYDVNLAHQISTEPLDLKYNSISRTKMYACN